MNQQNSQIADQTTFRHYLFFLMGQLISLLGSSVVNFALIWWITIESQSATIVSLTFTLALIPQIIVTLFAGVYIDRLDRKKIILLTDFGQAFFTFLLFLLFMFNFQSVWLVITLIIIRNLFQSVHRPTVGAIIPVMIPKEKLSRMNSINMIASRAIFIIGPVISGILIGFLEISKILWIDIGTFLVAVIPTLLITIPSILKKSSQSESETGTTSKPKAEKPRFRQEMKEGYRAIVAVRGMSAFFFCAIIGNFLLNPSFVLQSYFVGIYHEGNAQILSYLSAWASIAAIIGGFLMTLRKKWKHKSTIIIIVGFLFGIGALISALASKGSFVLLGLGYCIVSFGMPISNSLYLTILQEKIPLDKQGRVNAIDIALSFSIMPISSFLAGPLAETIGIQLLFTILSITIIVNSLIFTLFSDMRYLGKAETFEIVESKEAENANE